LHDFSKNYTFTEILEELVLTKITMHLKKKTFFCFRKFIMF